jgi:2-oxo-4-hydroxy-4-carboxy-5-ureidoimidazoline decarboxylase
MVNIEYGHGTPGDATRRDATPRDDTMTVDDLNRCSPDQFVAAVGPVFEHSPWIAAAAVSRRPFASRAALHVALCDAVKAAGEARQVALIQAHPDLVGRAVLTAESSREQASAGLGFMDLTAEDRARFDDYNSAYKARFGFPFVICARKNKKEAILRAFPERLTHTRDVEIATALDQIFQIAALRLADLLPDANEGEGR